MNISSKTIPAATAHMPGALRDDEPRDPFTAITTIPDSLEMAEDFLGGNDEQYRILFERAPDSIFLIAAEGDEAGRIVAANKASADQHGYTVQELVSMKIQDLVTLEVQTVSKEMTERMLKGEWVTFEIWHVRKDGSQFPLEVHAGPIRLKGKNYILGFDRDITSRKQAEEADRKHLEQINQLNAELERQASELSAANKELETFNYSVSHDMRGPLSQISGYCQLILEEEESLEPQLQAYVSRIYQSSCWLNEMIGSMLRLAHLTRSEFTLQPVDLSALVNELVLDLKMADPKRQIEVTVASGVEVIADLRLLKILMVNLLENSWKYTSLTPNPRIEFGVLNDAAAQIFFVRDNGAGFDMVDADKLFQVFSRLHDRELFRGSGIGLATVKRIVVRHGGKIWAEGEPEKGATFYFTLLPEIASGVTR